MKSLVLMLLLTLCKCQQDCDGELCFVYDNSPVDLQTAYNSFDVSIRNISEIGDAIQFDGNTSYCIVQIHVGLNVFAFHSAWPTYTDPIGFNHTITVNIYSYASLDDFVLGELIYTFSEDFLIPWRPEPDPNCTNSQWLDFDGICKDGFALLLIYYLRDAPVTLPASFAFAVSFDTSFAGPTPIGAPGPYDQIEVLYRDTPAIVGYDLIPKQWLINSSSPDSYEDEGAAGLKVLRPDGGFGDSSIAIQFLTNLTCDGTLTTGAGGTTTTGVTVNTGRPQIATYLGTTFGTIGSLLIFFALGVLYVQ